MPTSARNGGGPQVLLIASHTPLLAQWEVTTLVPSSNGMEDGLVLDKRGNIYVSQYDDTVVRRVTPDGQVSIYATGFEAPNGLAMDTTGNLYVTNAKGGRVSKVKPDGTVIQHFVTGLVNPTGVAVNPTNDTLYIAHYQISRISKVPLADSSMVTTWVSGTPLNGPVGLTFDSEHTLYAGNFNDGRIIKIAPSGAMTELARIPAFLGFVTRANDYLYVTSASTHRIYRIALDGSVEIFAGTGLRGQTNGPATTATFNGIVATPSGDTLYVSEYEAERLRMIVATTTTGVVDEAEIPETGIVLAQNFPNPFHASTTIPYYLAPRHRVVLQIYNMLGQKVGTLTPQPASVGAQSVVWDGRNDTGQPLPGGVYVYTLDTGDRLESKKLLLLR